ncbi:MAG: ATP-binding protein [Candidatus Omnitrophica bacterium]|nr:ATP-binding protein [Candidatus Omnitrophota bacterium]
MNEHYLNDIKRDIFLVHTISKELLRSSLSIDRIIHVILTGITAGHFLGFSRAFILFYDKGKDLLYGKMGIGPFDEEEAGLIWSRIEKENLPIEKFFENGTRDEFKNSRFNLAIERLKIKVDELPENDYFKKSIKEKRLFVSYNVEKDENIPEDIRDLLYPSDAVISPIFSERGLIGIIFADNAFHKQPITEEKLTLFSIISTYAALSIENAFKYNEVKNMQDKLIEKERFATMGKIASYITHEVKNPLVTICGFSKQILETDDIIKIKRNAQIIYEEVLRLEKIINNIINFSNISNIFLEEINITEIIENIIDLLADEIKEKNIEIKSYLFPCNIKGDPVQLKEVFFNIIKNGIENNVEFGKIYINCEVFEKFLKIVIRDTGVGIEENILEKVTTPFFTTKKGGLGLGLTIAKEIIEKHNGKIEIESKLNEGTSVNIYLPLEVQNEK